MTLFLTSHTGGYTQTDGKRIPTALITDNGFTENLKSRWPGPAHILLIASDPEDIAKSESVRTAFLHSFPMSGLPVREIAVWNRRNLQAFDSLVDYDVIILSGGHVPTQNAFFRTIALKEKLQDFDGILMGISAGTMNCARTVYAHPELSGEAIDPNYRRFLPGLGLTELMILPHYQSTREDILDGLRIFEDIAYPDSIGRSFLALNDGSYVLCENGTETLYGEAYEIRDGKLHRLCRPNECRQLKHL